MNNSQKIFSTVILFTCLGMAAFVSSESSESRESSKGNCISTAEKIDEQCGEKTPKKTKQISCPDENYACFQNAPSNYNQVPAISSSDEAAPIPSIPSVPVEESPVPMEATSVPDATYMIESPAFR